MSKLSERYGSVPRKKKSSTPSVKTEGAIAEVVSLLERVYREEIPQDGTLEHRRKWLESQIDLIRNGHTADFWKWIKDKRVPFFPLWLDVAAEASDKLWTRAIDYSMARAGEPQTPEEVKNFWV